MKKQFLVLCIVILAGTVSAQDFAVKITKAELMCSLTPRTVNHKIIVSLDSSLRSFVLEAGLPEACVDSPNSAACTSVPPPKECEPGREETPSCKSAEKKRTNAKNLAKAMLDPLNYRIMSFKKNTAITYELQPPRLGYNNNQPLQNVLTAEIIDPNRNDLLSAFDIDASNLLIINKTDSKSNPATVKLTNNANCSKMPDKLSEPDKKGVENPIDDVYQVVEKVLRKPSNKDAPAINFGFAASGAKNTKTAISLDSEIRPVTWQYLGLGGFFEITPFILETEVRLNQTKESDNKRILKLSFGEFDHIFVNERKRKNVNKPRSSFIGFNSVLTPFKVETDWDFKAINAVIDARERFPLNLYQSRTAALRIDPFVGTELGWVFKSPDDKPGFKISRIIFGGNLTLDLLRKEGKPGISLEANYIQRTYLKPEFSFLINDEGKVVASQNTKRARGHIDVKTTYNLGMFSPFVRYQYGRLPPKYILENGSFKTGIELNVDLIWKRFQ